MALPVTITGFSTLGNIIGPYQSSSGNYYAFGRETSNTIGVRKATDPTSSFSDVGTSSGWTTTINYIGGHKSGDTIHLIAHTGSSSNASIQYVDFDMSTDTFGSVTTIFTGLDTTTNAGASSVNANIVERSDGSLVIGFAGENISSMGQAYARVYYAIRNTSGTWGSATDLTSGGTTNWINVECVLGSSDRTHFSWRVVSSTTHVIRALTSAGSLGSENSSLSFNAGAVFNRVVSYDDAGTTRIAILGLNAGTTQMRAVRHTSVDSPSQTAGTAFETGSANPISLFVDGTDLYAMFVEDSSDDLYVSKSTDDGATFAAKALAFTASVSTSSPAGLSRNEGITYERGGNLVAGYIVDDSGTLKYNEYVIRATSDPGELTGTIASVFTTAGTLVGTAAFTATSSPAFTTTGSLRASQSLAGSTALTFTTAGSIVAVGALSSTTAVAFTTAGQINGAASLTGLSSPTFTLTGTVNGAAALTGSTSPAFTTTGTLLGAAFITGSSSPAFTLTGSINGVSSLSASANLLFTPIGTVNGVAALTGSTPPTFALLGDLTLEGAEETMTGLSALVFTTSGTLNGTAALSGLSDVTFTLSGTANGEAALSGLISPTFALTSALSATSALTGSGDLLFTPSGLIFGDSALSGSIPVIFGFASNLSTDAPAADADNWIIQFRRRRR